MEFWFKYNIFVGCEDETIKLIDIKRGIIINSLKGHIDHVHNIKKINHPKFGKWLISQALQGKKNPIKIWN